MATIEWPCPDCGQAQKSRDLQAAGRLCARCEELALPFPEEEEDYKKAARALTRAADEEAARTAKAAEASSRKK